MSDGLEREHSDEVGGRELDLRALGSGLRLHRRWIVWPTILCCVAAIVFVSVVRPRYTADAKVLIENGESYFTRPDKTDLQQPPPLPDDEAVQSQVQLITSRDIAREAIRRLNLKGNPEFDPLAKGIDPFSRVLILLGLESDPTTVSPEDRILQSYYDRLQVYPVAKSRVITIEFTATDPDLAARAANTIASLYIEAEADAKRDRARAAAESLGTLIADLRTRAAAAETKADEFRARAGLLMGGNNATIPSQQLADINGQLAQARTAQADAEAKAKLIRDMIRQGRIGEVPDVANNELIRRISEQRVALKAEVALQARTLLPGHPHMQELNAKLQDVDAELRGAAEKAVRTLENDAHIASSRVDNLLAALDAQKKTVSTTSVDQVELNRLDSQARVLKDQLEFNTAKYQEALARESATATPADARLISEANPPQLPSFPKKVPTVLIATLAGLVLSTAILIARELLSGRAFVQAELEETPLPIQLGSKPVEPAPLPLPTEVERVTAESSAADRLVAELASLRGQGENDGAARVLVTAVDPSAANAAGCLALARRLVARGRTILVEFASDHPAVVPSVVAPPEADSEPAGLGELLAGEATFAEIIHRDGGSRLHVVPAGRSLPTTDLDQESCGLVLDALTQTYDYVLLHVPAAPASLIDALLPEVDATLVMADGSESEDAGRTMRDALADRTMAPVRLVSAEDLASSPSERRFVA